MALSAKRFDKLRKRAGKLPDSLEKKLFLSVIDDMEKISNMITETKIDLSKHDEHGAVRIS